LRSGEYANHTAAGVLASPAFSHLGYGQTFFDEALLVLKPKRELELMTKWNISFDKFLDFAVTHELGHASCEESDEIKAERFGQRLRKSLASVCTRRSSTTYWLRFTSSASNPYFPD
jgi:hypothetical protein